MKIYNPKLLTTALSAGVFALGSFATMNAYAACVVCWSPATNDASNWCKQITVSPPTVDEISSPLPPQPVMWMSCYEKSFRSAFDDGNGNVGKKVTVARCENAPENYITNIPLPATATVVNPLPADNSWSLDGYTCKQLKDAGSIQEWVPRAADSLTFAPMCVVTNTGSDNEDVEGIGELAPGGTGLLNGACPAN